MSLDGKATANSKLQGKINLINTLHGKSAYEIAVLYGYKGTEAEWVDSLPYRLNTNTEFVFLGGNAKEAANVNGVEESKIVIDEVISDTSLNPVQNKVVKQYVDTQFNKANQFTDVADYIVEQGSKPFKTQDGNNYGGTFYYRVWNSGIAECWFNETIMFSSDTQASSGILTSFGEGDTIVTLWKDFTLPISFADFPTSTCSCGMHYTDWAQSTNSLENTIRVRVFCRSNSVSDIETNGIKISLQVKGRIK